MAANLNNTKNKTLKQQTTNTVALSENKYIIDNYNIKQ